MKVNPDLGKMQFNCCGRYANGFATSLGFLLEQKPQQKLTETLAHLIYFMEELEMLSNCACPH